VGEAALKGPSGTAVAFSNKINAYQQPNLSITFLKLSHRDEKEITLP
jgi:hypothetical protein